MTELLSLGPWHCRMKVHKSGNQKEAKKKKLTSSESMFYDLQADLKNLEASLLNNTGNVPLHDRFRALFSLKSLKTDEAVRIVSKGTPRFNCYDRVGD